MIKAHNPAPVYFRLLNTHNITDKELTARQNTISLLLTGAENDQLSKKGENELLTELKEWKDDQIIKRERDKYLRYLNNLSYDLKTQYDFKAHSFLNTVQYEPDKEHYLYVNKQPQYKDVSPLQILKILLSAHRIRGHEYRENKRRIEQNRPLQNHIKRKINCYLSTLKAHSRRNTIGQLKRNDDHRTHEYMTGNNQRYKVILKTYYAEYQARYTILSPHKLPLLKSKLETEFKRRLENSNKITHETTA